MPNFRIYYKVAPTKAAGYRPQNRHRSKRNRIEDTETHTATAGPRQYTQKHTLKKTAASVNGTGQIGYS